MKEGLLRWTDFLRDLQESVALGLFGDRLRLRQTPNGGWMLTESNEEQVSALNHTLNGYVLTPQLDLVGGVGVLVGGKLSTEIPAPTLTLNDTLLSGPTLMVVVTSRPSELSDYATPAELKLLGGLPVGGTVLDYFDPVGIISGGRVMTLVSG